MTAFRIANALYPIFDGGGAATYGGRWNSKGRMVIYASEDLATAMLENLVHFTVGRLPRTSLFIEITIPADLEIEEVGRGDLPGWEKADEAVSRAFGDAWHEEGKAAARPPVLAVPSVIVPRARNVIINQDHPHFAKIATSEPEPLIWDARLFRRA